MAYCGSLSFYRQRLWASGLTGTWSCLCLCYFNLIFQGQHVMTTKLIGGMSVFEKKFVGRMLGATKEWGMWTFRRHGYRWWDSIKMALTETGCEDVNWNELTQNRARWPASMNTMMDLPIPWQWWISWLVQSYEPLKEILQLWLVTALFKGTPTKFAVLSLWRNARRKRQSKVGDEDRECGV